MVKVMEEVGSAQIFFFGSVTKANSLRKRNTGGKKQNTKQKEQKSSIKELYHVKTEITY